MNRVLVSVLGFGLCAALCGCGGGSAEVSGTVTFDGHPVQTASLVFAPDGGGNKEGAVATDGRFTAKLPPGRYKIEVRASKAVGKRKQRGFDGKEEEIELTEEFIPARYNAKTELAETFTSGSNTVALDLKSK